MHNADRCTHLMEPVRVDLGGRGYDILLREGVFADSHAFAGLLGTARGGARLCVVSDRNVWRLYGARFMDALPDAVPVLIEGGEENKGIAALAGVFDAFAAAGLPRSGLVACFGGGIVGDVGGFAAACWMRGVKFVQIPTTLLAMVDSSVGGKTGVDIPAGKNLVGAFHQPAGVLIDTAFLATLPAREFASGMAEVVKTAALAPGALLCRVEGALQDEAMRGRFPEDVIASCIEFKRDVVEKDEREGGLRRILNFGHTFGHALEAKHGYGKYTHGEAVAIGMRIALQIGIRLGVTDPADAGRIDEALAQSGHGARETADGLLDIIRHDKKADADGVDMVLLRRVGVPDVVRMGFGELGDLARGIRV